MLVFGSSTWRQRAVRLIICASVVALMIQQMKLQNRGIDPDEIKKLLMAGQDLWNYDHNDPKRNIYSAGYINVERSISIIPPN